LSILFSHLKLQPLLLSFLNYIHHDILLNKQTVAPRCVIPLEKSSNSQANILFTT
jgi:hypothetical protein